MRLLLPLRNASDGSPTARGTVGERTAMLNSFPSRFSLSVYSPLVSLADISPPSPVGDLFLHRFEQEEVVVVVVGRWSRQKRRACGPLTTSCSLFCDTETVPRSVLRAAPRPVRHSRRRNPLILGLNGSSGERPPGHDDDTGQEGSLLGGLLSHATVMRSSVAFTIIFT